MKQFFTKFRKSKHNNPQKTRLNFKEWVKANYRHITPDESRAFDQALLDEMREMGKKKLYLHEIEQNSRFDIDRVRICLFNLYKKKKILRTNLKNGGFYYFIFFSLTELKP